jgi:hypothetical protein
MSFCPSPILDLLHIFLFQCKELKNVFLIHFSFNCCHFKELPLIPWVSLGVCYLFCYTTINKISVRVDVIPCLMP